MSQSLHVWKPSLPATTTTFLECREFANTVEREFVFHFVTLAKVQTTSRGQDFTYSSAAAFICPVAEIGLLRDFGTYYCCLASLSLLHWWINLPEWWKIQVIFYTELVVLGPSPESSLRQAQRLASVMAASAQSFLHADVWCAVLDSDDAAGAVTP